MRGAAVRRCCPIRGFSLTELLVVVAVILVLVSILIIGTEAVYSRAMRLKCTHRMEQFWQACLMYASASH